MVQLSHTLVLSLSVFTIRFCCVPVDFEVVNVDSTETSEDDINNAIMAIRRNGVALKGNCGKYTINEVIRQIICKRNTKNVEFFIFCVS